MTAAVLSPERGPSSFDVDLEAYHGPLDLLLSLIRDEKVDIYDIPVARIAQQFLARIRHLPLDKAADYLEMAARLLRIKAQMLLPRHDGDDLWEDPRAELVRRLLEYQQVREVVDHLDHMAEDRRGRFARAWLPEAATPPVAPLAMSLPELMAAVDRVLRVTRQPTLHEVVARSLDVPGAIETVREGETGIFFKEPTTESLIQSLEQFEKKSWDTTLLRAQAERFSRPRFRREIETYLQKKT